MSELRVALMRVLYRNPRPRSAVTLAAELGVPEGQVRDELEVMRRERVLSRELRDGRLMWWLPGRGRRPTRRHEPGEVVPGAVRALEVVEKGAGSRSVLHLARGGDERPLCGEGALRGWRRSERRIESLRWPRKVCADCWDSALGG